MLTASSQSAGAAEDRQSDWQLHGCANPYAEVRENSGRAGRRSLCPPRPSSGGVVAGETLAFQSNGNALELIINRQRRRPVTTGGGDDDVGGPYFLIRYDGIYTHARCAVYLVVISRNQSINQSISQSKHICKWP